MKYNNRQFGITLTEMVVVVAIVAMLVTFGLPAICGLLSSFETQSGAKTMISAALASARAIAAKEQRYAGVRFQMDSNGDQYMIFVIHDFNKTGLNPGFRAVEGVKPVKLPETTGVMDLTVRVNHDTHWTDAEDLTEEPVKVNYLDDANPMNIGIDGKNRNITDMCTFTVVFSPGGRLVCRDVRVRNQDGIYQPDNTNPSKISMDAVFNSPVNIETRNVGMFIQDDYAELGLGAELSRSSFVIYDKAQFDKMDAAGRYNYLKSLEVVYINPYTGTIINNTQ